MLVGVTMTEEGHRLFEGVLPVDDVESLAIDLAGRMAELVDRLQDAVDAFATAKPVDEWAQALATAADALTATSQRDAWQRAQLERILDDVVSEAAGADDVELTLLEVRALLAERLQGRPTRANFRTGHLTICTLVPMRSVPHRVVCLLGLDDAAFPRKAPRDGDDIMLADPHVGDRDPRPEDRQMLLDALMAASDRLIVTYAGNDVRTNTPRPPAVPVGELLDVDRPHRPGRRARAGARPPPAPALRPAQLHARRARRRRALELQTASRSTAPARWRTSASSRGRSWPARCRPRRDPWSSSRTSSPSSATRCARSSASGWASASATYADEVDDALPIELDALESWQIGQRMLDARLAGATAATRRSAAERARGDLPPGELAEPVLDKLLPDVEQIVQHADELLPDRSPAGSVDVRVTLPDGRRLNGTVPDVHGTLLRSVTYSRVNPRHRLVAWVRFLALTAAHPGREFEAATVGRAVYGGPRGSTVTVVRLPRMEPERRARAPRRARRALRRRACASRCRSRARPRPPTRGARRRRRKAAKEWESRVELHARGRGARAPARVRRRPDLRRAARDAPTSTAARASCGTARSAGSRSQHR